MPPSSVLEGTCFTTIFYSVGTLLNYQNMSKVTDSLSSSFVFQYVHESYCFYWTQQVKVKTESYRYVADIRFESVYCIDDTCSHALLH